MTKIKNKVICLFLYRDLYQIIDGKLLPILPKLPLPTRLPFPATPLLPPEHPETQENPHHPTVTTIFTITL